MPNACGSIYKLNFANGFDVRSPKQMKMLDFEGKNYTFCKKKLIYVFWATLNTFIPYIKYFGLSSASFENVSWNIVENHFHLQFFKEKLKF